MEEGSPKAVVIEGAKLLNRLGQHNERSAFKALAVLGSQ